MVPPEQNRGGFGDVFLTFLKLGVTSFGGPVAHIGYFRRECVARRRWVPENQFAELIAYCQCLPGPTSSQLGFLLGIARLGSLWGGVAAWMGFTLPSVLLLLLCAALKFALPQAIASQVTHGLGLVAVAVVAQAVLDMARSLTPDWPRRLVAVVAAAVVLVVGGGWIQLAVLLGGAFFGLWRGAPAAHLPSVPLPITRSAGWVALGFFTLLLLCGFADGAGDAAGVFAVFYRAGALVFGGGHVVLPLLQHSVTAAGWLTNATFMEGYGLAQAVPGPLFTLAAYLGAMRALPPNGMMGAALALAGIFLPGLLLAVGVWPFWQKWRGQTRFVAAITGINAAVVGILAAALIAPVMTTALIQPRDAVLAIGGLAALVWGRVPPVAVVVAMVAAQLLLG